MGLRSDGGQALGQAFGQVDILLPRKVYALVGDTVNVEELNLYFGDFITGFINKYGLIDVVSSYGRQYQDFWRMQPGNTAVAQYNLSSGSFSLTVNAKDPDFGLVKATTATVQLVSKAGATPVRYLSIGDSMTRAGTYQDQVRTTLPAVTLLGTRTLDDGTVCHEGRGGWTLAQYFTWYGRADGKESPFMFPVGVTATAYRGNTAFWKQVTVTDPNGYDFQGFQKLARGWAANGQPYLFDANGYPTAPTTGDVVFDPTQVAGQQFRQWDGVAWVTLSPQPSSWAFDFGKYVQRYAVAFPAGTPTHISILLGANDFQTSDGITAGISAFLSNLASLISSVRAWSNTVKIIIGLPAVGAPQDAWGMQLGSGQIGERYRRNMQEQARQLLNTYDTAAQEAGGIYVCPMNAVIDPVYGFDTAAEAANKYVSTAVTRYNNWVHPSTNGYKQMGDAMAALIQAFR